jgi:hypothetical protein
MRKLCAVFIVTALASPSVVIGQAPSPNLTLHPNGFGPESYAAWKAKEGRPDSEGEGDHALYFQKMVPTATVAAGIAVIAGFKKTPVPVASLTGLSWEHRTDGHCGAGAPRWNVIIQGASGARYTLFLGCAAATHTATDDLNWIRDSYVAADIVTVGAANAGITDIADVMAGTVIGLTIVFDEGTDQGQGFVFLDNITVGINGMARVWTGPMDNGAN